jgi:SAM-dependent methyltransferase
VGIDVSKSVLRIAKARYAAIHGVAADVRQLPFAGGTFDLIISNSTLDHFDSVGEIRKALGELFRVLAPGGEFVVTMDNLDNPFVALRNALPFRLLNRMGIIPYFVGTTLNAPDLRLLLKETGFQVMEISSVMHCPRVFAVALANLLQRFAPSWIQQGFLRILMVFERLASLPTNRFTGHFIAMRVTKADTFVAGYIGWRSKGEC